MNIPEILDFLKRLSENNTREWFQEMNIKTHKAVLKIY
jgi:hypothetical protein